MQYNRVIIVGNICADLQVKTVSRSGDDISVATARLAIDDSYKSKSGEKVERTVFVDVDIWGRQAETTAQFCGKGSAVLIEGCLQMDSWDDKETGQKRSKIKVRADRVQFIGRRGDASAGEQQEQGAAQPDAPNALVKDEEIPF